MSNPDPQEAPAIQLITVRTADLVRNLLRTGGVEKDIGFVLMMFEFGEGRGLGYASTAKREDVFCVLDEWQARMGRERHARMRELAQRWRDQDGIAGADLDELVGLILGPEGR